MTLKYGDFPDFEQVYQSWRSHDATQAEAASSLGIHQTTFSRLKDAYERDHNLPPRPPVSPSPEFWGVLKEYDRNVMASREAAEILGFSKTKFLYLVRRAHQGLITEPQDGSDLDRFRHDRSNKHNEQRDHARDNREVFER